MSVQAQDSGRSARCLGVKVRYGDNVAMEFRSGPDIEMQLCHACTDN